MKTTYSVWSCPLYTSREPPDPSYRHFLFTSMAVHPLVLTRRRILILLCLSRVPLGRSRSSLCISGPLSVIFVRPFYTVHAFHTLHYRIVFSDESNKRHLRLGALSRQPHFSDASDIREFHFHTLIPLRTRNLHTTTRLLRTMTARII